jgi:hypothetical protein
MPNIRDIPFLELEKFLKGRPLLVSTDYGYLPVDAKKLIENFNHREHKNTVVVEERQGICFINNIILK